MQARIRKRNARLANIPNEKRLQINRQNHGVGQMTEIKVSEEWRKVLYTNGDTETFHNVIWFDNSGNWLRIGCDEGYVLLNPENINRIIVPLKAKVR